MRSTPVLSPRHFSKSTGNFCMGGHEGAAHQWEPQLSLRVPEHWVASVPTSPLPPVGPSGKQLISRRGHTLCPQHCKSKQSSLPKRSQDLSEVVTVLLFVLVLAASLIQYSKEKSCIPFIVVETG